MTTQTHWPWLYKDPTVWRQHPNERDWLGRPVNVLDVDAFRQRQVERSAGPLALAIAFRAAAVADGWLCAPTYEHEPAETAFRLTRDGFLIQGLARPGDANEPPLPTGDIYAWGPDGLALALPIAYPGFAAVRSLTRHCSNCGRDDVETVRAGFANRVCRDCAPAVRAAIETPGWNS